MTYYVNLNEFSIDFSTSAERDTWFTNDVWLIRFCSFCREMPHFICIHTSSHCNSSKVRFSAWITILHLLFRRFITIALCVPLRQLPHWCIPKLPRDLLYILLLDNFGLPSVLYHCWGGSNKKQHTKRQTGSVWQRPHNSYLIKTLKINRDAIHSGYCAAIYTGTLLLVQQPCDDIINYLIVRLWISNINS